MTAKETAALATPPTGDTASIDWADWYERWERQQDAYVAHREARFAAMLDMLESLPANFTAIDLACGPGSISRRVLARFPEAHIVAVDFDPVMLAMAQAAVPLSGGRLTVIEADLARSDWATRAGLGIVDAALSTTAIHWLDAPNVLALYRTLAQIIRPGGVFMNGDHLHYLPAEAQLSAAAARARDAHSSRAFGQGVEDSDQWWAALGLEPAAAGLLAARARAFAAKERPPYEPSFAVHRAALLDAGFSEVDTIWQHFENRVLAAVR